MKREGPYLLDELMKEKEVSPAYDVEADCFGFVHGTLVVYRFGEDELPLADCLAVCNLNKADEKAALAQIEFSGTAFFLEEVITWLMDKHKVRRCRKLR